TSACISGWCMTNRQAVAIPDIYADARVPADVYRPTFVRSLAMAPVGLDEPIGALGAYWSEKREPRPEEIECLQAIADAAALATANVQRCAGAPDRSLALEPPPSELRAPKPGAGSERGSLRGFIDRVRVNGLRPNSLEAYVFAVILVAIAT